MSKNRVEDTAKKSYFRAERFVCENGLWYFSTREGTLEGPFASRPIAEQCLKTYIAMTSVITSDEMKGLSYEGAPEPTPIHGTDQTMNGKDWVLDPYHRRFGPGS